MNYIPGNRYLVYGQPAICISRDPSDTLGLGYWFGFLSEKGWAPNTMLKRRISANALDIVPDPRKAVTR